MGVVYLVFTLCLSGDNVNHVVNKKKRDDMFAPSMSLEDRKLESKKIKELEEQLRLEQMRHQQDNQKSSSNPKVEAQMKAMEEEKKRAEEEALRAKEEMKALREEMMNLKTSVTRQPIEQPTSSGSSAAAEMMAVQMKAQMDMQMQMMKQQQQQQPLQKSAAEIELEQMKEEKRNSEMKALRDEMIEMRQGGANSPDVLALKNEMAEMRAAAKREQEDLREKLSSSLGTVDITSDPGLATVRRTNKELKQQYQHLMDRVEEQSKLITELRTGVVQNQGTNAQAERDGTTNKDIIRMKNELNEMKGEMAMRQMEQEQKHKRRQDIDDNLEEELRAMMQDSAGVFTSVAEMEANKSLGNEYNMNASPINTERLMRMDMNNVGNSGNGNSLNLDAIISGAGGAMDDNSNSSLSNTSMLRPSPQRGGRGGRGGGGGRSSGMTMAGESLSSASKFIFPDGHTAPAMMTPRSNAMNGSNDFNNDSRLQNSSDVAYRQQGVPSLRLDQLNQGGSQGRQTNVDRLNVTHLYEANNQKLLQLNQLSTNPEDMASQDQLDQLLVNFLNHKAEPNGAVAVGRMGPSLDSGSQGQGSLRTESRYLKT